MYLSQRLKEVSENFKKIKADYCDLQDCTMPRNVEHELEQLKIEREEEERPRKRSHQSRQEQRPTPPEEDVEMDEGKGRAVDMPSSGPEPSPEPVEYKQSVASLGPIPAPKSAPKVLIPLRAAKALPLLMSVAALANAPFVGPDTHGWHTGTCGMPADIQMWITMFHETVTKRVWVPSHVLFGHWLVTKKTNEAKHTMLQQYVLEHWYMPTWQRKLLKVLAHDKNIVKSPAGVLRGTGWPVWPATSVDMAEFLQFNEVDAQGCPYNDACQTLNLHLVRGLLTFEALMPLKPNCSMATVAAAYSHLQKGLIYNFVDADFYAHTTSINSWVISPNTLLTRWMHDTTILVNEEEVVYHCAVAGVTPTMMDDCWSFGYQWLVTSRSLANPLPGWTADELDDLLVVAGSVNAPPGLYDPVLDVFPRATMMPWKSTADMHLQISSAYREDIPGDPHMHEKGTEGENDGPDMAAILWHDHGHAPPMSPTPP
ncbi:hypothetical protein B0H10DRAFT_1954309 [Mycena sp. CBHHK59/15]|nr:hypothetical protein B0H10DRAFT_1954309 [Mycena sp. CBHHK59/15]